MNMPKYFFDEKRARQRNAKPCRGGQIRHRWRPDFNSTETRPAEAPTESNEFDDASTNSTPDRFHWKRIMDVLLILPSLPVLIPLGFCIGLFIRSVSTGPILFKQERIGFRGQRFFCLKFRTMFVSPNDTSHQGHLRQLMKSNVPMTKLDSQGDPRIIPFGVFLRALGLDELPQLINVLRGEMSLVGPRPCLPYEYEEYLPWQKERFETLPGLTGLWQVSGKNRTTFVEMIQFDIHYARNMSLWLDCSILMRTIPAVMTQLRET